MLGARKPQLSLPELRRGATVNADSGEGLGRTVTARPPVLLGRHFSSEQKRKTLQMNLADGSVPSARVHSLNERDKPYSSVNIWGYNSA